MNENTFRSGGRRAVAMALLGGAVIVGTIAGCGGLGGRGTGGIVAAAGDPDPTPAITAAATEAPVIPEPTLTPAASAAPAATPDPDDEPGRDAIPLTVQLLNATGADVHVDIDDLSGTLVDAVSGTPGDGMSVEPYTLRVENIDAVTLRLTWIDFPIDSALALYIDESARRFVLVQPEPGEGADAMGFDRELILTFSEPISAGDVEAFLQDGLDVPG